MEKAKAEGSTTTGFLIDGYPRELDQGLQFEKDVSKLKETFFFIFIILKRENLTKLLLNFLF